MSGNALNLKHARKWQVSLDWTIMLVISSGTGPVSLSSPPKCVNIDVGVGSGETRESHWNENQTWCYRGRHTQFLVCQCKQYITSVTRSYIPHSRRHHACHSRFACGNPRFSWVLPRDPQESLAKGILGQKRRDKLSLWVWSLRYPRFLVDLHPCPSHSNLRTIFFFQSSENLPMLAETHSYSCLSRWYFFLE